jgi:hypothetical protein
MLLSKVVKHQVIFNGAQGHELQRQLPPLSIAKDAVFSKFGNSTERLGNQNYDDSRNPEFLPIGVGGISDQSNIKYNKIMSLIMQNENERNYRINAMFLNN